MQRDDFTEEELPTIFLWLSTQHVSVANTEGIARTAQKAGMSRHVVLLLPDPVNGDAAKAASEVRTRA